MPTFDGALKHNIIQNALFNMIISQDILPGKIASNYNLVDKARVDGTLFGDTKLYYDVPNLLSYEWKQDDEAGTVVDGGSANVLKLKRPAAPKVQAITLGEYRQVMLTKDDYLSKQAFGTEGAFSSYQSVLEGRLAKSKEIYENTTYNTFFGTVAATKDVEVPVTEVVGAATGVEANRLEAQAIAQKVADVIADMKDYSTEYTKNGFLRAFSDEDIHVVWNVDYLNKITKLDLPTIFHKDIMDKFGEDKLPARYFGEVNDEATAGAADGSVRSLVEQDIDGVHFMAGQAIPADKTAPAGKSYTVDADVICKIYTKLPPFMSAFSVGTSFFNAKNLSTNMYLTWGHNHLEALDSEAIVTVHAD